MFIAIEGGEGCGKTTLIENLKKFFQEINYDNVVFTREPGGNEISEKIRNIILNDSADGMDPRTEMLLFAASRSQSMLNNVLPFLDNNKVVITDRSLFSSLIYQGYVGGVGVKNTLQCNLIGCRECIPDVLIYLDLEPNLGLKRIDKNNNREKNRIDNKTILYHNIVREGFLKLCDCIPDEYGDFECIRNLGINFFVVDASLSEKDVFYNVCQILRDLLKIQI